MSMTPANPLAAPDPWDAISEAYVADLLPMFESFSRAALRLAELPAAPRIVDVATGPGTLSIMAAAAGAQVTALDFSPQMLAQLRQRARQAGVLERMTLDQGDGQNLPYGDASFDGAFSMFGLIFFPDRVAGFRQLHRVLKPGRKAVVSSWAPLAGPFGAVMEVVRAHLPGPPPSPQAILNHAEDYQREMAAGGFGSIRVETLEHERELPSAAACWASIQRSNPGTVLARRKLGEEAWRSVSETIYRAICDAYGEGKMVFRARAVVGIGTR